MAPLHVATLTISLTCSSHDNNNYLNVLGEHVKLEIIQINPDYKGNDSDMTAELCIALHSSPLSL